MNAVVTQPTHASDWKRNFLWLIKRELWEHRGGFLITPLVISGVSLLAWFYLLIRVDSRSVKIDSPGVRIHVDTMLDASAATHGLNYAAYTFLSMPFLVVMFFVTAYYAMDALYADRRDRSFLFWKSLPVSDFETVLSKLTIAALVAPAIAFAVSIVTQLLLFGSLSIKLAANGYDFTRLWAAAPVFQNIAFILYALVVIALWFAPIWAWCLLASSWARRAVFLWATVPLAAAWFLEYQTFGTQRIAQYLLTRLIGMLPLALNLQSEVFRRGADAATSVPVHFTDFITPGVFFASAQLWIGLGIAAALVAATVWMRRYREAI